MSAAFKNILIPVDFSVNTDFAINKGIELAEYGSTIHLLHVQSYSYPALSFDAARFLKFNGEKDYKVAQGQLLEWKHAIEDYNEGICVTTKIDSRYSVQDGIEREARSILADLIIISKKSYHKWLTFLNTVRPTRISKQTGIPVMTIRPGFHYNRIKNIMILLGEDNDQVKVRIIEALSKYQKVKVFLVTFLKSENNTFDFYKTNLVRWFKLLRTLNNNQAEHIALDSLNKINLLNCAKSFQPDLLILDQRSETKASWINQLMPEFLGPDSGIHILLVDSGISKTCVSPPEIPLHVV